MEKTHLRREVERYRQSLERSVEDLTLKNEEIRSFYHVLSHELKTPLTVVREFVSIVLDGLAGELGDKQREYLGVAQRNCDSLRHLLDDILDATRMETGKLSMNFEMFQFELVTEQVALGLQRQVLEKSLSLDLDFPSRTPRVWGDPERIAQLLTNLLTNAIKFTDPGGRIRVRVRKAPESEALLVEVVDTGRGIEADRLPYIFERMYQVKGEDFSILGGLGLGLNICREIARSHGCQLEVSSVVGQGSTFRFSLPLEEREIVSEVLVESAT